MLIARGTVALSNNRGVEIAATTSNWRIGTNGDGVNDEAERNIISGNVHNLYIAGTNHVIAGNFIGTNASGNANVGINNYGVRLLGGTGHRVGTNADGTADSAERNIISGNSGAGVTIEGGASSVTVTGNYIGTDVTGTNAIANATGVLFGSWDGTTTGNSNRVGTNGDGTNDAAERNVISGNTNGVDFRNGSSNTLAGNYIGVAPGGVTSLANQSTGVRFIYVGGSSNTIGGDVAAEANIIANNGDAAGEYGLSLSYSTSDGNKILRNIFYNNYDKGIKLSGDGSNNDIPAPAISSQTVPEAGLTLTGTTRASETLQLYLTDPSHAEGQTYITDIVADGAGAWSYTLAANKTAGTWFVATTTNATDGTSEFSSGYLLLNELPLIAGQTSAGAEETDLTVTLPEATDANADTLSYKVSTPPTHGTLYQTADGVTRGTVITAVDTTVTDAGRRVIFAPATNGFGNGYGNFGYKANDGAANSSEATATINVTGVQDAPTTVAVVTTANEDTTKTIALSGSDVDGDSLTYAIVAQPSHGSVANLNNQIGSIQYVPTANYNGTDSFTYRVNDGTANSNASTVSLTIASVNDAPVAANGSASIDANAVTNISLSASDVDTGSSLTYSIVSQPGHGTLSSLNTTSGSVTYTPTNNYSGTDSFTFKVNDGSADSNVATMTIQIAAAETTNTPPVVNAGSNHDAAAGSTIFLRGSATDADGDSLTYAWSSSAGSSVSLTNASAATASATLGQTLGGTTVTFTLTVSDGTDSASDSISIRVLVNEISSQSGVTLSSAIVASNASGEFISQDDRAHINNRNANKISFWNDCQAYTSTNDPVAVLVVDENHLIIGDPWANDNTGLVVLFDAEYLNCGQPIDFESAQLTNRRGVTISQGNQEGDLFGETLKLGDVNGDGINEIYATAPGNANGFVFGLDASSLTIVRLFLGSEAEQLKSQLIEFGNVDENVGTAFIAGVTTGASRSTLTAADFNGFEASTDFPETIDFSVVAADFNVAFDADVSHLLKADLDNDGTQDVLFGSQESCQLEVLFGSPTSTMEESDLNTLPIICDEATEFAAMAADGDITGDGANDLILGFPLATGGNGRIIVLPGPFDKTADAYDTSQAITIDGDTGEALGSLFVVADYDGDGIADLLTQALNSDGETITKVFTLSGDLAGDSPDDPDSPSSPTLLGGGGFSCGLSTTQESPSQNLHISIALICLLLITTRLHRVQRGV